MLGTELLDALPVAVYMTDAEGRITYYNEAAAELWGHRPELGTSRWCGAWKIYWPDGRSLPHDQCPMAIALREGREVRGVSAIAERPDGTRVHLMPYPTLLRDASGKIVGAVAAAASGDPDRRSYLSRHDCVRRGNADGWCAPPRRARGAHRHIAIRRCY